MATRENLKALFQSVAMLEAFLTYQKAELKPFHGVGIPEWYCRYCGKQCVNKPKGLEHLQLHIDYWTGQVKILDSHQEYLDYYSVKIV